jgi:hypothetical protein
MAVTSSNLRSVKITSFSVVEAGNPIKTRKAPD